MSEPCQKCPIAEHCLRRAQWCDWMHAESPDPQNVRHIIGRSRIAAGLPQEYPSTGAMAVSLWRSVKAWAKSGFKMASRQVRRARLAVCHGCDRYDALQKRCLECGCKNSAKVWIEADKCPLDKWPSFSP